ncbi:type IV secretion system DNA-binding domain-containing protein [Oscillatoriales cyanobacterium LEGE 11467]|uniref:Type IV secretion system DNA-binding domain-containing protein n=1 Tax=Zarconia navalis LEGE 11467 TaxID=1828826 RepID=A0A928VXR9_9CYAN|nr:type IV secretion system DNA-binding domain-containing protein [Zarconia navalis]MBE9040093.1 type IV secretion system DNA-binding domain-containing protein [Zarconia navalis LEGE 11467]
MNKFFKWGIAICIAAIAVPLIYSLGSTVTAYTLILFELEFFNPNNIVGSVVGALWVLTLAKEVLTEATDWMPLYDDLIDLVAAGIFRNPHALARTRTRTYQQAFERLQLVVYPKLKPLAAALFVLVFFTAVFVLPIALLTTIYLGVVAVEVITESRYRPWDSVVRGFARRQGADLARKWIGRNVENLIRWGASFVLKANEPLHYLILGVTGAGKSLWRETMMAKVLPGNKGIVNDPKPSGGDGMVPLLEDLGVKYYILNPFDYRCTTWWIAKDVKGPNMAYELAAYLIPILANSEGRFFDDGGRIALEMIIVSLQIALGENWTFRQVILFSQQPYFEILIKNYHPRPHEFDEFLKAKKMEGERNDILLTLQAKLMQFNSVAALWERALEKLSLQDFVSDSFPKNTAIVMGSDPIHSEISTQTNALMFGFAAKYLKALPTNRHRRIWVFLDEAASEKTAPWPEIDGVMALGRGAGVACCLGFHSISLLKRTYGELVAMGLFGLARHKAIFGVDDETSQFLSKSLGDYEYLEQSYSSSVTVDGKGKTSYSDTTSERLGSRPVYLASEFQDMNRPPTGVENGLLGDFIAPGEGIHSHHYSWDELLQMLPQRSEEVEAYQRIPNDDRATQLKPLSDDELRSWLPEAVGVKNKSTRAHNSKSRKSKTKKRSN